MKFSMIQFTSIVVLLFSLWLIIKGVYYGLLSYSYISWAREIIPDDLSFVETLLLFVWRISPLIFGGILWKNQRYLVRWLARKVPDEHLEDIGWQDAQTLLTLSVGLIGLFFLVRGIDENCNNSGMSMLILSIDHADIFMAAGDNVALEILKPVFFQLFFGIVLLLGSTKIGNLIGKRIDQSLISADMAEKNVEQVRTEDEP